MSDGGGRDDPANGAARSLAGAAAAITHLL